LQKIKLLLHAQITYPISSFIFVQTSAFYEMQIPEIDFRNRKKKNYDFQIISNKVFFKNVKDNEVPFRPHLISYCGILFTMEGEGFHLIDFKRYPYQKGTVIFLSKEQVH